MAVVVLLCFAGGGGGVGEDPFSFLRRFHPRERVIVRTSTPWVRNKAGRRYRTFTKQWVRQLRFRKVTPELLAELRRHVARSPREVFDRPGKAMTVVLSGSRPAIFDYRARTLELVEDAPPKR